MNKNTDMSAVMPPGHALLRQLETDAATPWPWDMQLALGPSDILASWTEADDSHGFLRFAILGSGSELGLWTSPDLPAASAPVAFLDSEGAENQVIAKNFEEFLAILALGEPDPSLAGTIAEDQKESLAQARAWLQAHGVKVPRGKAKSIMDKAQAAHAGFQEWLEGESLESLEAAAHAGPPIGRLIATGDKDALVARLAKLRWDDPELVKAIQEEDRKHERPPRETAYQRRLPVASL